MTFGSDTLRIRALYTDKTNVVRPNASKPRGAGLPSLSHQYCLATLSLMPLRRMPTSPPPHPSTRLSEICKRRYSLSVIHRERRLTSVQRVTARSHRPVHVPATALVPAVLNRRARIDLRIGDAAVAIAVDGGVMRRVALFDVVRRGGAVMKHRHGGGQL